MSLCPARTRSFEPKCFTVEDGAYRLTRQAKAIVVSRRDTTEHSTKYIGRKRGKVWHGDATTSERDKVTMIGALLHAFWIGGDTRITSASSPGMCGIFWRAAAPAHAETASKIRTDLQLQEMADSRDSPPMTRRR